ncbi:MAG TPA: type VI secretion system lipoprotein TssJ [Nitrosospira sp.]
MKLMPHTIRCVSIVILLFIAGCASTPKPAMVKMSLRAQSNVNPDAHGRASPIVVKFFELKSSTAFDAADFFSIFDNEQKTLGAELINSEVFQLHPGEKLQFDRPLQPDTRYVAVVAAFRDLEHSQWRASAAIPPKEKPPRVVIQVDSGKVTISAKRKCFLWCGKPPQKTAAAPRFPDNQPLQTKRGPRIRLASDNGYRSSNDALE